MGSSIQNLLYKSFQVGKLVSKDRAMDDYKEEENEAELLDEGLHILEPTIDLSQLEALIEDVWSLSVTEEDPIKSFRTTLHDVKAWAASEDLIKEGVENCSLKHTEIQDPSKRKKKKAKRRKYRT